MKITPSQRSCTEVQRQCIMHEHLQPRPVGKYYTAVGMDELQPRPVGMSLSTMMRGELAGHKQLHVVLVTEGSHAGRREDAVCRCVAGKWQPPWREGRSWEGRGDVLTLFIQPFLFCMPSL